MYSFGENQKQNDFRKTLKAGIPVIQGLNMTRKMVVDIMGHHLAHMFVADMVFGSEFCGPIFAGMMIMNQCLLLHHGIHPTDVIGRAYQLLQLK